MSAPCHPAQVWVASRPPSGSRPRTGCACTGCSTSSMAAGARRCRSRLAAAARARSPPRRPASASSAGVGGRVRLDALDRSPLLADVDRGGRALLEITGEARTGAFELRIPAGSTASREGRSASGCSSSCRSAARRLRARSSTRSSSCACPRGPVARVRRAALAAPAGRARRPQGRRLADRRAPRRGRRARRSPPRLAAARRRARPDGAAARGDRRDRARRRRRALDRACSRASAGRGSTTCSPCPARTSSCSPRACSAWRGSLGLPRGVGHVGALAAIGGYVLAVGPQPSVIRAAVSGCAVSIAWLVARERDQWHVLALAAVVLLGWNPYLAVRRGLPALVRRRRRDLPLREAARARARGIPGASEARSGGRDLARVLAGDGADPADPVRAGAGARRRRERAGRAGRRRRCSGSRSSPRPCIPSRPRSPYGARLARRVAGRLRRVVRPRGRRRSRSRR